jgi:hypothetical protein
MNYLRSDQYTQVDRECPIKVDLHPAENFVEIALGEYRIGGDMLRLLVDHPDTCVRLAKALHEAHNKLIRHLHATTKQDSAMPWLDSGPRAHIVS